MKPTSARKKERGQPLTPRIRTQLRVAVDRDGVRKVASQLGMSTNAVIRALAALTVLPGTALLIESRLAGALAGTEHEAAR